MAKQTDNMSKPIKALNSSGQFCVAAPHSALEEFARALGWPCGARGQCGLQRLRLCPAPLERDPGLS
eukprot:6489408-Amphidinium_carterae.2